MPIKAGTKLAKPEILFTKLEDDLVGKMEEIANQRIKAANTKKSIGKGVKKNPLNPRECYCAEEATKLEKKNS